MFRGLRLRLVVALLLTVAGALGVVYLIVVPSLESRLIDAKLDVLAEGAATLEPGLKNYVGNEQGLAELASSVLQARVAIYTVLRRDPPRLLILGDSSTTTSRDIERDPIARQAGMRQREVRGTVERGSRRFAEVAIFLRDAGVVILLSDSLADPLSSVELVKRRLLIAGLIGLLFAATLGSIAATAHVRRIRRLERAAERIAGGHFDEPVVDLGRDELGELAVAFERMRARLEKLDRARREFIANASHELRTPLFSLGGFLELLADEDLDEETRQEFLATMREQVDRLAKLAIDLLDLSRLDAGRMRIEHEPVDLAAVVRLLADEFRVLAERRGQRFDIDVAGTPVARADELRVLQIGRALVDNALVHTPPGTQITLRTRADREHAYLEVVDDGPGVPAEHAPHVFDRFYRGEGEVASGTGLGLAIARELAGLMNGQVELESVPGRTVVRVALGAAPTSVASPPETVFT